MNFLLLISTYVIILLNIDYINSYKGNIKRLEATSIDMNSQCFLTITNNKIKFKVQYLGIKELKSMNKTFDNCSTLIGKLNNLMEFKYKRKKLTLKMVLDCRGSLRENIMINDFIVYFNIHNKDNYNILYIDSCSKKGKKFLYRTNNIYNNNSNLNIYLNELVLRRSTMIPCGLNYYIDTLHLKFFGSGVYEVGSFANIRCPFNLKFMIAYIKNFYVTKTGEFK